MPTDPGCGLIMAKYFFSNYFLDVDERRLLRDNEELRLRGKLFDTLRVLVENAGKLVRKDAFMESVWQTPLSKTTIWTIAFRSYENCSTRRNTSKPCHDTVIDSLLELETSCQHPHELRKREASPSLHCLAKT